MQYDGTKNYKAILLNYNDEGFIKVELDDYSKKYFFENLSRVKEVLSRKLIIRIFYEMALESQINSK